MYYTVRNIVIHADKMPESETSFKLRKKDKREKEKVEKEEQEKKKLGKKEGVLGIFKFFFKRDKNIDKASVRVF